MTQMNRRTVAKGAAWTLPVVAIGVAAPAQAASSDCEPVSWVVDTICKLDPFNHGRGKRVELHLHGASNSHHSVRYVFVVSVTVANTTTIVNDWCGMEMTLVTDRVPNGDLHGPGTPVSITYKSGEGTYTANLLHGSIPDCRSHHHH